MILLIDNFDSFVYNLARHFERLGQETLVVRNDALDPDSARTLRPSAIVLSPGPCTPDDAGQSLALVSKLYLDFPLLGVCLGHQIIAQALGGRVVSAHEPMHGHTSMIGHTGRGIFHGLPSPLRVCRYHSLIVEEESLPAALLPTAWSHDGVLMALEHVGLPVFGVQFHPEAILTECGYTLLANFLRLAGLQVPGDVERLESSELCTPASFATVPSGPVTY
jgi:anthranilate synthase/aminodeoxychorismate synthase-like glutamine amidotransferase